MKILKQITAFLLLFMLCISCVSFAGIAEEADQKKTYEVVILLDVSQSMTWEGHDPLSENGTRVSTEASKAFAYWAPKDEEFRISIIPFNHEVTLAAQGLNASSEADLLRYEQVIDNILNDSKENDSLPGIRAWYGLTDIGRAFGKANEVIANSTADQKAVLLFADGAIQVLGSDKDPTLNDKSKQQTIDICSSFAEKDIRLYCVGLGRGEAVDEEFLTEIADTTGGEAYFTTDIKELYDKFRGIYSYLINPDKPDIPDDPTPPIVVGLDGTTQSKEFDIYGGLIKEANYTLICDSEVTELTVISPSGVDVTNNSGICKINRSVTIVNIKLNMPEDGIWKFSFKGKKGAELKIHAINWYDTKLMINSFPERIECGKDIPITATILNKETNSTVVTKRVYTDSEFIVNVTGPDGVVKQYKGYTDEAGPSFKNNISFDVPGTYKIICSMKNEQFSSYSDEVEVTATYPELKLSLDKNEIIVGENITGTVGLYSSDSDTPMTSVPAYMNGLKVKLRVYKDSESNLYKELDEDINSLGGGWKFQYKPDSYGTYYIEAVMTGNGVEQVTNRLVATASTSKPIVSAVPPTNHVISDDSAKNTFVFELDKYLRDSDGDAFTYQLLESDADFFECKIDGNKLTVKILEAGSGKIVYSGSDGKGALGQNTIEIKAEYSKLSLKDAIPDKEFTISGSSNSMDIDIGGCFSDSASNKIEYEITGTSSEQCSASIDGTTLNIEFAEKGSYSVTVQASNAYGETVTMKINFEVSDFADTIIIICIVVAVLILLVVGTLIFLHMRKRVRGMFGLVFEITDEDSNQVFVFEKQIPNIESQRKAELNKPKIPFSSIVNNFVIRDGYEVNMDAIPQEFNAFIKDIELQGVAPKKQGCIIKRKNQKDVKFDCRSSAVLRYEGMYEGENHKFNIKFVKYSDISEY